MAKLRSTKIFGDLSVTGGIRINGIEVSENFKTGKVTATTNVTTDTINTLSTGNAIMRYHENKVKLGSTALPLQLDSNRDVVIRSGDYTAIEITNGGAYGRNFIMGSGGNVLIGAGESNTILKDNYSSDGENMVIGGDESVDIVSNLQSGWGSRKILKWEGGKLSFDSQLGNTPSIYRNSEGSIRVETSHGTTDIGMMNSGYSHFQTSAGSFYFNKSVALSGDLYVGPLYNQKVATENWVTNTAKAKSAGAADTAAKLTTARTLTIGSAEKTFDGSGNVSWSLAEIGAAADSHSHSIVKDSDNDANITFAYSKAAMGYHDYSWLAGWNGYELRAVSKTQFARADHSHSYLPLTGGTMSGNITMSGSSYINFTSDERLKNKNFKYEESMSNKMLNVPVWNYEFKDNIGEGRIGVMAQDLQREYGDSVNITSEDENGFLSINLESMMFIMWKSIQELKEENDNLRKKIKEF